MAGRPTTRALRSAKTTTIRLAGCTIHVNVPNTDAWTRYLAELIGRAKDLQPVLETFGAYMVTGSLQRNFEAEGRPAPWAPLSPLYAARKARRYPGRPILVASGQMRAGFQWRATKQTLKIWNTRPYWKAHQYGYPPHNLPARVMLFLQNADKAVFTRWARRYITTGEL
jgi:phage gpG-like protein